jgi:hypothetical protein
VSPKDEHLVLPGEEDPRVGDAGPVVALLSVVLPVFDEDLGEEHMSRVQVFDGLAEVRRVSGLNPIAALDLLNECGVEEARLRPWTTRAVIRTTGPTWPWWSTRRGSVG